VANADFDVFDLDGNKLPASDNTDAGGQYRLVLGPGRYDAGRFAEARSLFERMSTSGTFNEFLTLPAYDELVALFGSVGPRH
jgi:hypothetical protein